MERDKKLKLRVTVIHFMYVPALAVTQKPNQYLENAIQNLSIIWSLFAFLLRKLKKLLEEEFENVPSSRAIFAVAKHECRLLSKKH